ncbi:MAG: hypothetical protein ABI811_20780 [Acidobacteriota bacterium]
MNLAKPLVLFALMSLAAAGADPKWISIKTPNFTIFSSANERDTRAALNYFQRVRGFFVQMLKHEPPNPLPVTIVMFGSDKEYSIYRPRESTIAYYTGGTDRDYIVLGKTGDQTAQAATHEYVHLILKHLGMKAPPWLDEGIAELFSTMRPIGDTTEFGQPIAGRLAGVLADRWVPLATILAADHDSPYYNETNKAGNLYNESWALVWYLTSSVDWTTFWQMAANVSDGAGSVDALEKSFGKPLAQIEKDLQFYVKSGSYRLITTKIKLDGMEKLEAEPANLFNLKLAQADLMANLPGVIGEARKQLQDLTREDAKRPEPWSALGYMSWRDGKLDDALANFGKAYDLGDRSRRLLWDYGRMSARSKPDVALLVLGELLKQEPEDLDVRIELASVQVNRRQAPAVLELISGISKVKTVNQGERLLYMRAWANVQVENRLEARARAEELKRMTKSPDYVTRADELLKCMDQVDNAEAARKAAAAAPPINPRELIAQLAEEGARVAEGTLTEMVCASPSKMILQTEAGRKSFLMSDPTKILVSGTAPQMKCGVQAPAIALRLQYTTAPDGSDADGVVRVLQFPPAK